MRPLEDENISSVEVITLFLEPELRMNKIQITKIAANNTITHFEQNFSLILALTA